MHSEQVRSYNMSRVKSKNTKPELIVRKFLYSQGFRYKLHVKQLPGKPDIVLPKYKTVIFVNGCFWHGHEGCKYSTLPKTRTAWWDEKIKKTIARDNINKHSLLKRGWAVITFWACGLKIKEKRTQLLDQLINTIKQKIG
ncbi:very short patch repair endonuclease [Pedobacter panaciterrae]|uniref:very short patch repair endonuclease n=1 Tax=Pedobacter panaciterrae TaxID=363849 RepID=UPI00293BFB54|nr:very short patch repair endonuclease [Pedobacter panaciterrae]